MGYNMKGILFYFSGTGNTKWIADRFKDRFNFYGSGIELINIERNNSFKLEDYDFIIIGTSIYAGCGPRIMDEFLNNLQSTTKKMKCILYSTQGTKTSSATAIYGKILEKKGYNIEIKAMIHMPNNYYFLTGKAPAAKENDKLLKEAALKVKKLTADFIQENKINESSGTIRAGAGIVISKLFRKHLPKMSSNLISTDDCIKCGLCLNNCPVNNITFENGKATFHSKCILCLRCIHSCPMNAIRYKGKRIEQTQKEMINSLELR